MWTKLRENLTRPARLGSSHDRTTHSKALQLSDLRPVVRSTKNDFSKRAMVACVVWFKLFVCKCLQNIDLGIRGNRAKLRHRLHRTSHFA
jgi:hypothetical protein